VILGVLDATAASKFINVSSDANIAVLKSVSGAVKASGQLVYTKSVIQNLNNSVLGNDLNGDGTPDIETRYGYPSGSRTNGISNAMSNSFAT